MVTNIYRLPGDAEQIEKLQHRIDQGEQLPYTVRQNFLSRGNFMVVFAAELLVKSLFTETILWLAILYKYHIFISPAVAKEV